MKTIYKKDTLLKDGEVYVLSENYKEGSYYIVPNHPSPIKIAVLDFMNGDEKLITHSTAKLEGVTLLPRDKFVKPKDVEKLARKESERIVTPTIASGFYSGFMHGYNANPNKFTIDHLKTAWAYGVEASGTFQDLIKIIIPLSLPESLEINEQGEIVNVIW